MYPHLSQLFSLWPSTFLYLASFAFAQVSSGAHQGLEIEELDTPSQPKGSTLFTELPPDETGMVTANEYLDPRMWQDRYQEFALGAIGTGVTVGDYDNDGLPDIFIVNKTGSSRLYRNLGNWKFQDTTDEAGLGEAESGWLDSVSGWFGSDDEAESVEIWKQGAAFVDVNNDGYLDLYTCRFAAPNKLYLNDGDGTFHEADNAAGLGLSSASGMAAFCDFDRDGWLDVYVQTNMLSSTESPEGKRDRLYRNNGDGTFTDFTDQAGIGGKTLGHSATWWDYDEDGWPDLYIANDFATPDQLFRNNGASGRFNFTEIINSVVPHQPFSSMGADIGDVNNDSRIDLFVADMAPTTHEMDQRGMAITRFAMRQDNLDTAAAPQYMYNALYLNTGSGRMQEGAWMYGIARTDWTWSTRFEDLDNDGFLDLHVTNGMVREYQNDDLRQRIFKAARVQARMSIMKSSPVMSESNLAYRNIVGKRFERVDQEWGLGQVGVSFGAAFGDFDRDGDLDLVYSNYEATPTVLRNDSETGGRAIFVLRGTVSNRNGVGATVRIETDSGNQIRQLVLARGYLSSSEPVLHFGLGEDHTIERAIIDWPSGHTQVLEHLPANRRFIVTEPAGLAQASSPSPEPLTLFKMSEETVELGFGAAPAASSKSSRDALLSFDSLPNGPTISVGDLDGDKLPDIAIGQRGSGSVKLLFGAGNGKFRTDELSLPSGDTASGPILVEDFDADGDRDILVVAGKPTSRHPSLLLNQGDGSFDQAPKDLFPDTVRSAASVSSADFNRDGSIDLFLGSWALPGGYPVSANSCILVNREGRFEEVTENLLPYDGDLGLVTDSVWSDIDLDGWPDLIVSTEWGPLKYLHNIDGVRLEDKTEEIGLGDSAGLWSCIAAGDFNNDGKPDFAAGNIGLNTRYHAGPDSPAILYYGDFGGRGRGQIIEAYYENGRLLPLRSRKELIQSIPSLENRFRSTDEYAAATLEEILGAQALSEAKKFEAKQLQSGVFLSQNNGRYKFHPFPHIAQIAPIRGISVADFNEDGNLDLAMTQNLYQVEASVARFDGGLGQLLLGDGNGNFAAIEPAASGLILPGDGRDIVGADIDEDGHADIITIGKNSDLRVFTNRIEDGVR